MKYSDRHEEIVKACLEAETLTEIELKITGATPNSSLRRYIMCHKIPMPRYIGCSLSKQRRTKKNKITIDLLVKNTYLLPRNVKEFLFDNNIKKRECEICQWKEIRKSNGIIPIQIHHIDGNPNNWELSNLQILCPNCHSLTDNYSGCNVGKNNKNKLLLRPKKIETSKCIICENEAYGKFFCSYDCHKISMRIVERPTYDQLLKEIEELGYCGVGRKYKVSDNSIRKWLKYFEKQKNNSI